MALDKIFRGKGKGGRDKIAGIEPPSALAQNQVQPELTVCSDFYIDNVGVAKGKSHKKRKSTEKTPDYQQSYSDILQDASPPEKEQEPQKEIKKSTIRKPVSCFRCQGPHRINECPLAQSPNSSTPVQNQTKSPKSTSRYHDSNSDMALKYKPGVISEPLRKALRIEDTELPPYIYSMRMYGYPPGWLEEARIQTSGLAMYDADGKDEVLDREEGEVLDPSQIPVRYDVDRLVDYPGFNVVSPSGVRDDWMNRRAPPLQECFMKENFVHYLQSLSSHNASSHSQKSESNHKRVRSDVARTDVDMEIDDEECGGILAEIVEDKSCKFIPPLPPPLPPPPKEPPPLEDDEVGSSSSCSSRRRSGEDSPSMEDLENKKRLLMLQLKSNEDSDDVSSGESSTPGSSQKLQATSTNSLPSVISTHCASKSVDQGTPALLGHSEYRKLPDVSKFADGISEHMPYENLPNSTGSFEKIRNVLKLIRQRSKKQ